MSQVIIDAIVNNSLKLSNENYICDFMDFVVDKLKMTVIHRHFYHFEPCGLSVCYMLKESHFCIHTYPEKKIISIDIYTCKDYEHKTLNELLSYCIVKLGVDDFLLYEYIKRPI